MSVAEQGVPKALDWVIVGGGIHGVHLAVRLIGEAGVAPGRLRIVDPGPTLLHSWRRCSSNTGMRHLRSPAVHHLDLDPWSLLRFAGVRGRRRRAARGLLAPPYDRPSVDLFADHCDDVISRYGLADLHVRGTATEVTLSCDGVGVDLSGGGLLHAHRVLLAMGAAGQPRWPAWASALQRAGAHVHHVFEPGFVLEPEAWPDRVVVIGGGITGAQVALRLARGGRGVHLIGRHDLRKHQFDSDPGWVGPRHMRRFLKIQDLAERRQAITSARHVGSVPPDVYRALRGALDRGAIRWHQGEVSGEQADGGVEIVAGADRIRADAVLLATGFESRRSGGALVDQLVESHALPCASCGFPVVDPHLRWHPRVFVTGPLAELEIGPVSRNIVGARRAAERIVAVAHP